MRKRKPAVHRVTLYEFTPAWCNAHLYPDRGTLEWPKVTCKNCIRAGGEIARDEIGAHRAERRYEAKRLRDAHGKRGS